MKSDFETEPQSHNFFDYRIGSLLVILMLVLIYVFYAIGTVEAESKTVSINVNGLVVKHTTGHDTVGDLVDELYPDTDQLVSVFPDRKSELTTGTTIFVEANPTSNPLVVANLGAAQELAVEQETAEEETKNTPPTAPSVETEKIATPTPVEPKSPVYNATASWYKWGDRMTTASTQFPRGTKLRVEAIDSGKYVDVVVNDYGPEAWTGVMLDLNSVAFAKLAPLSLGKIAVKYYVI